MEDVLHSSYYKTPFGYINVDWFVNEVRKLEIKMNFYFKNTKKDIIRTEEDKEGFDNKKIIIVDFKKKILNLIKLEIIVT